MKTVYVAILLSVIQITTSSNILAIFPSGTKSHDLFTSRLANELHSRGHNLTVLSVFPELYENMNTIYLKETKELWLKFRKNAIQTKSEINVWSTLYYIPYYGYYITKSALINTEVQQLMNSNTTFDLILLDEHFNEAFLGFSHIFNSPIATIRITISQGANPSKLGSYDVPSVVPSPYSRFTDKMTFWERFQNSLLTWWENISLAHIQIAKQELLYNEFFKDPKPSLKDLNSNISLILQNSHLSTSYVQPRTPNSIDIGGLHIVEERKALPQIIADIIDSSDNGVIYFALGGNVEFSHFPQEKRTALMNALKRTNHTVLLKVKGVQMERDGNILINEWFPQNDILGHPKTKLFVTHGGIQSFYEAVYHAVPMVGIPILGDQSHNVAFAVNKGLGLLLEYEQINEDYALQVFTQVLEDHTFQENADLISKIYRDRQHSPMENAIYWLEYVIRYNGAYHLKSPGLQMGFTQYYSLDVIAVLIVSLALTLLLFFMLSRKVVRCIFRLVCCEKTKIE